MLTCISSFKNPVNRRDGELWIRCSCEEAPVRAAV